MEGFLQGAVDLGKSIAIKVHPIIDWIAVKISGFIDVSSENVHLLILAAISLYLADFIAGREKLSLKFWGIAIGLWFGFKYLGF